MTYFLKTTLLSITIVAASNTAFANNVAGKKTYIQACAACHTSGVAGAPKMGDLATWSKRIAAGNRVLYNSAIRGKGAMPAKGGQLAIPDNAIKAAVDYMVINSSTL